MSSKSPLADSIKARLAEKRNNRCHEPALTNVAGVSVQRVGSRTQPSLRKRLTKLLEYIEAGRPSNYAPWRECELVEMEKILRGDGAATSVLNKGD